MARRFIRVAHCEAVAGTGTGHMSGDPARYAQAKAHGGFIFPDSDQRLLGDADLKGMSLVELRLARNEIYARRGRFLSTRRWPVIFRNFPGITRSRSTWI